MNHVLVDFLACETEGLRPGSSGVNGPGFVQGEPVGGSSWFAPEQQGLGIHVHLRGRPSGGAPGQRLAVAVGQGVIGPPGWMKTG